MDHITSNIFGRSFFRNTLPGLFLTVAMLVTGCGGGGDSSGIGSSGLGDVSTNFPYLTATPQVSYVPNIYVPTQYDVTVTVEATGPNGVYAIGLWINSSTNSSNFEYLDLQHVSGNTWTATTNVYLPLPAGNYHLDSIMLEDGDTFAGGQVKSGWYQAGFISTSHYSIDQRLTDTGTPGILEYHFGISNIPVVNFALP